ncbi:AAA family ATPase [Micromonospora echinofusca]|uniref:P-loop NTPase n=1 Tax=Micromonospora echinofusca TaxID=47858 RepID=A0ABS3VNX7_MICEH|nr:P-loop NTPase [Micromonospora echinofusca]MBO4206234.1 P-loop NTPase [Micromonospora echinofusca]
MTILYEPNRRVAQQFAMLLGSDTLTVVTSSDLARLVTDLPGEWLVVLGPGVELGEAMAMAAGYRLSRPSLGVVLIRAQTDVGVLGDALRAGIREVVPADDSVQLLNACARSVEISRQLLPVSPTRPEQSGPETDAKVVTVFAAKGGCGKTTVATNLAVALAEGGRRRVGLIDLDLAFGDVAIMLQLVPERSMADAVGLGPALDGRAVRALFTPYGPGVDALLAPTGPTEGEQVKQDLVTQILQLSRSLFDFVVIDTPPQFNDHVLVALDLSHQHVLLTTPDIPALKNLRITLDTFDLLNLPQEHRLVVLNRSDAKVGLTSADIARVIRTPIAAYVPSSRDVPVSINRGVPIVLDNPQHPVSRAIQDLAVNRLADGQPGRPTARGLRGLLGRGRR